MTTARILVPPGIGDGWWVLIRLRDFMRQNGIDEAQVWIHDGGGPKRAHGMWERCPLVKFMGYQFIDRKARGVGEKLWRAYNRPGTPIQKRVLGFDYFLSVNGNLDAGCTNEEAMPGVALNWTEQIHDEAITTELAAKFRTQFDDYVVTCFWDHGYYGEWLQAYSEARIVETLRLIADTGRRVLVMGADWDKGAIGERIASADPRFLSLIGETDFDDLTGLLRGAAGVVGFPAGNTMLGPYFGTPTVLLWNEGKNFPRSFWTATVPPNEQLYRPLPLATATPAGVVDALLSMVEVAA